jgi:BCD family chlorophyll transporter-like MFS transporter
VLGLSVSETTMLTAFWAIGTLAGFGLAGKRLERGAHMHRVAALGILAGIGAFSAVIFAGPFQSTLLFSAGAGVIGFGGGLFAVGTMLAAMDIADSLSGKADTGFVIGAWSAVQATAIGLSLALGGILKDAANALAANGYLGEALSNSAAGYMFVYHIEIALLFISLVVLGPLVGRRVAGNEGQPRQFGLADMPG